MVHDPPRRLRGHGPATLRLRLARSSAADAIAEAGGTLRRAGGQMRPAICLIIPRVQWGHCDDRPRAGPHAKRLPAGHRACRRAAAQADHPGFSDDSVAAVASRGIPCSGSCVSSRRFVSPESSGQVPSAGCGPRLRVRVGSGRSPSPSRSVDRRSTCTNLHHSRCCVWESVRAVRTRVRVPNSRVPITGDCASAETWSVPHAAQTTDMRSIRQCYRGPGRRTGGGECVQEAPWPPPGRDWSSNRSLR